MPPLPRYTAMWNVQAVLKYLKSIGLSSTGIRTSLSLMFLTFKLAMLLALTLRSHSIDLAALKQDLVQKKGFSFQWP